jgi:hypothetical protein
MRVWFFIRFSSFSFTVTVRGCVSLKKCKWKSQGKAVEVTVINKEENSKDLCLRQFPDQIKLLCFVPEFFWPKRKQSARNKKFIGPNQYVLFSFQ